MWNKEVLGLTKQIKTDGGLPTSLMVNAPPNLSSLKNYSLQQINNGNNRRLSINWTESIKTGKKKQVCVCGGGGGDGESTLTHLSDEVQHLFLTAASQTEPKCQTLPDVWTII